MGNNLDRRSSNARLAALLGFYLAYFLSYFIKLSPSIVMPAIQQRYGFSSGQTGFISSMFFIPYAAMQFFVGPICRRTGAGNLVGTGLAISGLGLLIFSNGSTVATLAIGRFLLGLGTSPIFIGMIYFMQRSFTESAKYARVYGLGIFVSNLGSITAAAPLKAVLNVVPMDSLFLGFAVFALALGVYIAVADRAYRTESPNQGRSDARLAHAFRITFTTPVLVSALLLWLIQAPSLVSYQGLWCTKWTATAFPSLERLSGWSGIAISIGSILSSLYCERLFMLYSSRTGKTRGKAILRTCILHVLATLLLAASKQSSSAVFFGVSMLCDVLFGYTTGAIIVQVGIMVKENSDPQENASIMGVFNGVGCLTQQLGQWLTGVSVDLFCLSFALNASFSLTFICLALVFTLLVLGARKNLTSSET
ncbi:MAG: MFS transporter [Spirochaetales bacterium]|nr:MFS transporter [Spirochaetales bacterium]